MPLPRLFVPIICAVATIAMGVTSASAATSAPRAPTNVTKVTEAMHVVAFDEQVAAAHGYEIRTAPDGTQYSVSKGSLAGTASPDGVVEGPCGVSYVYEYGIGNRAVELYSGFSVILPEVGGHWQIRLSDRGGTSFKNYNVAPSGNGIWQFNQVVGGLTKGPAQATVVGAASFTILDNGAVCYSGGPTATTTIT
jgi:hypothetical protein